MTRLPLSRRAPRAASSLPRRRSGLGLLVPLGLSLLVGPAGRAVAQSAAPSADLPGGTPATAPATAPPSVAAASGGGETLGNVPLLPGDAIRVKIWLEPGLSGDFQVDESGQVVLPKLGARLVAGLRPDSVRAGIIREYLGYLNHSSVEVILLRRVQVAGAVRNPGLYTVDGTMTIADALALAGGVSAAGRQDNVELLRAGQKVPGHLSGRTRIADSPLRSGDQLYVPERSWLSRNPGIFVGALGLVSSIILRVAK
ncbi:MAG TPA: SLBB domain-containing protein [Gemmatimonadales bacterium]|nr:SLBB domain-containing protein [Gemmatimonadales bacterium]